MLDSPYMTAITRSSIAHDAGSRMDAATQITFYRGALRAAIASARAAATRKDWRKAEESWRFAAHCACQLALCAQSMYTRRSHAARVALADTGQAYWTMQACLYRALTEHFLTRPTGSA